MLCINSRLDNPPVALDSALVMVAALDSVPRSTVGAAIGLRGSAWISVGPSRPARFRDWRIDYRRSTPPAWRALTSGSRETKDSAFGAWDTRGLLAGQYLLRLVVRDDAGDTLVAYMQAYLDPVTAADTPAPVATRGRLVVWPNPVSSDAPGIFLRLSDEAPVSSNATAASGIGGSTLRSVKIFDLLGREMLDITDRFAHADRIEIPRSALPRTGSFLVRCVESDAVSTAMLILLK
jgi:hypothetical protein